jgi:hypothetical protein
VQRWLGPEGAAAYEPWPTGDGEPAEVTDPGVRLRAVRLARHSDREALACLSMSYPVSAALIYATRGEISDAARLTAGAAAGTDLAHARDIVLWFAARAGDHVGVEILLGQGADPEWKGGVAAKAAAFHGHDKVVALLAAPVVGAAGPEENARALGFADAAEASAHAAFLAARQRDHEWLIAYQATEGAQRRREDAARAHGIDPAAIVAVEPEDEIVLSIAFESWRPGDADAGEASETGFMVENEAFDIEQVKRLGWTHGFGEVAGNVSAGDVVFRSTTPDENRAHFEEGVDTFYTLTVHRFNGREPVQEDLEQVAAALQVTWPAAPAMRGLQR